MRLRTDFKCFACTYLLWAVVLMHTLEADCGPAGRALLSLGPAYSHQSPTLRVGQELTARGWQVKYLVRQDPISQDSMKKLSIETADTITFQAAKPSVSGPKILAAFDHGRSTGSVRVHASEDLMRVLTDFTWGVVEDRIAVTKVQAFKPDVMVANVIFPAGAYVADKLNIPKVAISVVPPISPVVNVPSGLPAWPGILPVVPHWKAQPMGFWARMQNLLNVWEFYRLNADRMNRIGSQPWKQGGLQHVTYAASLQQSAAWIFQGDTAWLPAIPLSPHAHLVGSLTAAEPQPLPEPFKSVCDGASGTGLVYVSMGTTAAPEAELVLGLYDALIGQPRQAIWVLGQRDQQLLKDKGLGLPPHVFVTTFAPQNSILGHPSTAVFVTQGGTNSLQEALYHGVPQIVIPLFFEQPWNADQIQWLGAGVSLACKYPIRRSDLGTKLGKALPAAESDSMRLAAQQIGRSMRAHRWTAAQKAASVVEHVAWTGGSLHNRVQPQHWLQSNMVDVALFFITAIGGAVAFLGVCIRVFWQRSRRQTGKAPEKQL